MVRLDKIIYMITCFKPKSTLLEQFDYSIPDSKKILTNSSIEMIKRIGVIPRNKSHKTYLNKFYNSIPYGRENFLIENLNIHSLEVCTKKDPFCNRCNIINHCDYQNKKNDWDLE